MLLQSVDTHWRGHLSSLDHLRQGIHLRGYAQQDPKQEYKREAFELFASMLDRVRNEVVKVLLMVKIQSEDQAEMAEAEPARLDNIKYNPYDYDAALRGAETRLADISSGPSRHGTANAKAGRIDQRH